MSGAAIDLDAWPHLFEPGDSDAPVLLTLHGTGGNEREITALVSHLWPGAGVLSPRGRVSEQGMTRWFRRMGEGVFDVDDVIARASELAGFLAAARERYGLGDMPIIAAGFSNGANIALATALLHPEALDRVVAFSGMYPFADRDPMGNVSAVDLVLLNGAADPMAPSASVDRLVKVAQAHGAGVERHVRPGGHGLAQSDVDAAREWLAAH
ncbi:phospholipase/carboxylesterase [Microbacterium sp. SLBN-154]|uniref:alpha/beta hydrolase n=1 Tax=Microbacterium sp. SLBN-154 TaxID=2768458 RepID=UPI0011733454|nr:alpha/beta hydrolase [Microbacterium sp. SLBN-154]TQK18851.1 phospholipase/carboxylesterase [Microbacterium sp. SLBN-154]